PAPRRARAANPQERSAMKVISLCWIAGLTLALPMAGAAQQRAQQETSASDLRYCHALSHAYSSMWSNNAGMPVGEAFTLGQCDSDTQKTIATLEQRMKDQKIELPPRQGLAQAPASHAQVPCSDAPTSEACTDGAP